MIECVGLLIGVDLGWLITKKAQWRIRKREVYGDMCHAVYGWKEKSITGNRIVKLQDRDEIR